MLKKYVLKYFFLLFICMFCALAADAQVTGVVVDAKTRQPLDFVNVYYEGKNVGEQTDENGRFVVKEDSLWNELTVSTMGYVTQVVKLVPGKKKNLTIKLVPEPRKLQGVTITAKKTKYSRKNNPAVELMRKVIEAKKMNDLRQKDFFTYTKYEKMTFSINEFTDKVFEEGEFKRIGFLERTCGALSGDRKTYSSFDCGRDAFRNVLPEGSSFGEGVD